MKKHIVYLTQLFEGEPAAATTAIQVLVMVPLVQKALMVPLLMTRDPMTDSSRSLKRNTQMMTLIGSLERSSLNGKPSRTRQLMKPKDLQP